MKKELFEIFLERINIWKTLLRLDDWDIEVEQVEELDSDILATISPHPSLKKVVIQILSSASRESFNRAVIHELLHIYFFPLTELWNDTLKMIDSQIAKQIFNKKFHTIEDRIIDQLVRVLLKIRTVAV